MINAAQQFRSSALEVARETAEGTPPLPSASVPSGMVWPPVAGRAQLEELAVQSAVPLRVSRDAWALSLGGRWRLLSSERYADLEEARIDLFKWAALHRGAEATRALSSGRCLVLNPEPAGAARLWQIVPAYPSLRHGLDRIPRSEQVKKWTERLVEAARALTEVPERLAAAGLPLEAGLDRLGRDPEGGRPVFIGFIPPPRRLKRVAQPALESIASNLDSTLFELAFSRRTVLLGVAATLDALVLDALGLDPALSALREAVRKVLEHGSD